MKKRVPTKMERIVLKNDTPLGLHLLQLIQGLEATVGNGLVGERPEALTGLQLRGVGGQKHQMDALRHGDLTTLMPAREGPATNRMRRCVLAPTACAKCCKAMLKTSTLTEGSNNQWLAPVSGCMNPYT